MSSIYRESLEKWLRGLEISSEWAIDVGGAQQSLPKRVKSWDVKNYLIADLPDPHQANNKIDIELDLNICNRNNKDLMKYKGMADSVFCFEVFEYIYNPMFAMESLSLMLRKGGKLYLSAPFYYPVHEPIENDYLRYTEQGLIKLAQVNKLQHIKTDYRLPAGNALLQANSENRLKASKAHQNHNVLGFIMEFEK